MTPVPIICRTDGRQYTVASLTANMRCLCGSDDLDLDFTREAMEGDPLMGLVSQPDMPMETLSDTDEVSQHVTCSTCFYEGEVEVSDPGQPLPACPNCGAETLSAAGSTMANLVAPYVEEVRRQFGKESGSKTAQGVLWLVLDERDDTVFTKGTNGRLFTREEAIAFAQTRNSELKEDQGEPYKVHYSIPTVRQLGSKEAASDSWADHLEIVDFSYGLDPYGPGSKGFYVAPKGGHVLNDDPFQTSQEAREWATENWPRLRERFASKTAAEHWFQCNSCGMDYSSASAYRGCPNCGSSDVEPIDRFGPRAKKMAVSESKAQKVLKAVEKTFAPYIEGGGGQGPKLIMDWDWGGTPTPTIVWEEGPYEWTFNFPYGGIDEEFGGNHPDATSDIPDGVFLEPYSGWALSIYDDAQMSYASKVKEVSEGILATNPGMSRESARSLAHKTIKRFPKMVKKSAKYEDRTIRHKTADIAPESLGVKVGDIFDSHWGYDQTNVDFYEVVGLTPHSVRLRKLRQTRQEDGFMTGTTMPLPGQYAGEPFIKRIQTGWRGGPYINLTSYSGASPWDGTPQRYSSYA